MPVRLEIDFLCPVVERPKVRPEEKGEKNFQHAPQAEPGTN